MKGGAGGPAAFTPSPRRLRWLINSTALARLLSFPGVRDALDSPNTYVVVRKAGNGIAGIPNGWTVTPVLSFTSYQALHTAVESGSVPRNVKAVLYDNERWRFTPLAEQQDPAHFMDLAARDAHAAGLELIATPATNLGAVNDNSGDRPYTKFLNSGILAAAARSADVVDIQAQGSVSAPDTYARFVTSAVRQIRDAGTRTVVLAGLSTNPAGAPVSLGQLHDAVRLTRDGVDGYWLNVPAPGPYCPNCNDARPDLAAALLNTLPVSSG